MSKRERGAAVYFRRQKIKKIDKPKTAIALSGGGSHGAFAAGIMHTVFTRYLAEQRLPRVDTITGTSTGALVAASLVELYGRFREQRSPQKALQKLRRYYTEVTQNEVAILPKGLGIATNLLCIKGIADIRPLRKLIDDGYREQFVQAALAGPDSVKLVVNFVDMLQGKLVQIDSADPADFAIMKDSIYASCAQPVVMTPAYVHYQDQDRWATDGGVREVIPIRPAMRSGATHILAVALNEPTIDPAEPAEPMTRAGESVGSLLTRVERGLSVMNDEIARMDERVLRYATYINRSRDVLREAGVDAATIRRALPPFPLEVDADPNEPGDQDPYEDKVFNNTRVREIMVFRFKQQKLPDSTHFIPDDMRKMWDEGVEAAERDATKIDALLFAAGEFRRLETPPS